MWATMATGSLVTSPAEPWGREKRGVGMGQCLRHQMHWEDLEEYQVGR